MRGGGGEQVYGGGVGGGLPAAAQPGESGFGYGPVCALPARRTMAEAGDEKQTFSHRSSALRAMMEVLREMP